MKTWKSLRPDTGLLCALLFTALLFTVLPGQTPRADTDFISPQMPCNPVRLDNCVLPYPSDVYTRLDGNSPTGRVLDVPFEALRPQLQAQLPDSLTPETVLNGSSGFSAATSVLFELDRAPDLDSLPADGGAVVIALDLDTGEQVPVRVALSEYARSGRVSAPRQIIEIYPRARWQFGHRHVVALTRALKPLDGGEYQPSDGFLRALQEPASAIGQFFAPGLEQLQQAGVSPDDLISATLFTVRDEQEVTAPLQQIMQQVYEQDHPVRNLRVTFLPFGPVAAVVLGDVMLTSYRSRDHGLDYQLPVGTDYWTDFRLTLPRLRRGQSAPVALYGHGLSAQKETDPVVSLVNAAAGVATLSIDQPNHGTRKYWDGGDGVSMLEVEYIPLQLGMTAQSPIDFMALLKAVETSLGTLDVLPKKVWSPIRGPVVAGRNGDGIPDLDTSRIFYQGTSLGGVLGTTFVALAPSLRGAFLQVPGVGVTSILSGSKLWNERYYRLVPRSADGAEALLLKTLIQHQMDYADAINFVHYIHNPLPGKPYKKLALVVAHDDPVVPNFSSTTLAELTDTPLVGPVLFDMPGVRVSDEAGFENGNGLIQVPPLLRAADQAINEKVIHLSFVQPAGVYGLQRWIHELIQEP